MLEAEANEIMGYVCSLDPACTRYTSDDYVIEEATLLKHFFDAFNVRDRDLYFEIKQDFQHANEDECYDLKPEDVAVLKAFKKMQTW